MIFDELRGLQQKHGYLPADELRRLSQRARVPLYRIHAVASFYPQFHLTPQPSVRVCVCGDISCHLRGAGDLRREMDKRFGGERMVSVGHVSCLGQCDRAPAIVVNDRILANATMESAAALVAEVLSGNAAEQEHERLNAGSASFASDPYRSTERYSAVRELARTRDWDGAIEALKRSALGGLGGAGFPTHAKWQVVRNEPGPEKYVVCNADESEPGTTKDRCILEFLPHLVIEGMIVCGLVTGARYGFLYIRHEYEQQKRNLTAELDRCRREGLLGRNILGSDRSFDIELFISPGGYICGEGSAMLEAIEGNRAEPRIRPPNTAIRGLWQKPTVLNNVETFAQVPQILAGRTDGRGATVAWKFVSVSGDVLKPGVFEVHLGTPLSKVILDYAGGPPDGKKVKAFTPSGAASGFVPASFMDVRLDFQSMAAAGTMLGSGAIVVCAEGRCMIDMALNCLKFFRNESCGKCVPCRIGSQKFVDLVTGWTRGEGKPEDVDLLQDLSETLRETSICGLGQFVPNPFQTVLKYFQKELEAHIFFKRCPERVCPMAGDR